MLKHVGSIILVNGHILKQFFFGISVVDFRENVKPRLAKVVDVTEEDSSTIGVTKDKCKKLAENRRIEAEQVGQLNKTMDLIAKLIDLHGKSKDGEANIKFARVGMNTVRTSQRVCSANELGGSERA